MMTYIESGVMADVSHLDEQLANFRMGNSQCYCCTHGHVHPITGEALPCDRQLIYRSLEQWHGGPARRDVIEEFVSESEFVDVLAAFDMGVRTMLRKHVTSVISADTWRPSYNQCISCSIPVIWGGFDDVRRACVTGDANEAWSVFFHAVTRTLVALPVFVIGTCWLQSKAIRLVRWAEKSRLKRLALAANVWVPLLAPAYMMIWIPGIVMPLWCAVPWYIAEASFLIHYLRSFQRDRHNACRHELGGQLACDECNEPAQPTPGKAWWNPDQQGVGVEDDESPLAKLPSGASSVV
eukprot:TRINITY_DN10644_c0_g1_i1.p1 TRINITY_DN10644_c0_g1~~TRINITY_DN10644_c0_g1_i1.p1  ORF type:complete len:295 (+),score=23.87 TRINITY_DN10644_c0_g1_i1:214-1098(+)